MAKSALPLLLYACVAGGSAEAVVISYTTTPLTAPITFFPGTQQQAVITPAGCPGDVLCQNSVNLVVGQSAIRRAGLIQYSQIGVNDGTFPGPSTTFTISTRFDFAGKKLTLTQTGSYFQIANEQFMFALADSGTNTVNLRPVGLLDVMALGTVLQLRPSDAGAASFIRANFTLRAPAPVPEPAVWLTMIVGFGLAGAALRRARSASPEGGPNCP